MNFEQFKTKVKEYLSKKSKYKKLAREKIVFENNEEKNYIATFDLELKNGKVKHTEISYDGEWTLVICDYYPNATPRVRKGRNIENVLDFLYELNIGDIGE